MQLIENYISYELQNPQAADDTIDGISEEAEKLATFPEKHQFVSDPVLARLGFRMTWYGNYNIFYIYDEFEGKRLIFSRLASFHFIPHNDR